MLPALVSQHLPLNVLFYIYYKRTQRSSAKSSSLVFYLVMKCLSLFLLVDFQQLNSQKEKSVLPFKHNL